MPARLDAAMPHVDGLHTTSQGSIPETLAAIRSAELQLPAHLPPGAKDFISRALTRDPTERPTMQVTLSRFLKGGLEMGGTFRVCAAI